MKSFEQRSFQPSNAGKDARLIFVGKARRCRGPIHGRGFQIFPSNVNCGFTIRQQPPTSRVLKPLDTGRRLQRVRDMWPSWAAQRCWRNTHDEARRRQYTTDVLPISAFPLQARRAFFLGQSDEFCCKRIVTSTARLNLRRVTRWA